MVVVAEKSAALSEDKPSSPQSFGVLREASRDEQPSQGAEATPPFWTWFIKNPRSPGQS